VLVENGEHGSSAAGPIAREMVKAYLRKDGQKVAGENMTLSRFKGSRGQGVE
jgi:hypothetical protein